MKPLQLLCITRAAAANAGGMERLSFELIEELKKQSGIAVNVMSQPNRGRFGTLLFIITSLPTALLHARRADIVHCGDPVLALHAFLIRKIWRKKVAVTIHGLDISYPNPLYQLYLRLFGHFDLCLPISKHAEKLLHKSPITSHKSQIITPGVHDRFFDPSLTRDHLAQLLLQTTHYSLPTNSRILFTAGRLVKRKGHAWFIEHVLPKLPENTIYIVAGDGPERENIAAAGGTAGGPPQRAERQVLLLGRVTDEQLKILYNTVDAFVQPNISVPGDAEGFGIVLLEAALCQRPVVAANLDGIPDAIHDGHNGTLIPALDSTAWVAALNQNLSPNPTARDYTLKNFSWAQQTKKYLTALRQL